MEAQPIPETMLQAVRQFADPQVAHDFFVQIRFPYGVACPRIGCGSARVAYLPKVRRWYCNECKRQSSVKVGTIFEDSPMGLDKWLPAIWLLASNRNGISSCEIARALGVTQKTAWFMLHRIRTAMASGTFEKLAGPVEADETYIGGYTRGVLRPDGSRKARGPRAGKTIVMGIVERREKKKGKIRAFVSRALRARRFKTRCAITSSKALRSTRTGCTATKPFATTLPTILSTMPTSTFVVTFTRTTSNRSGRYSSERSKARTSLRVRHIFSGTLMSRSSASTLATKQMARALP